MALGAEVVDLIGLHLFDDALQVAAVREIAVMKSEAWRLSCGISLVGILIEVIDAGGVEGGGAAFDAVYGVALLQEEFREIGAVLAGDPSDERLFHGGTLSPFQPSSDVGMKAVIYFMQVSHPQKRA